MLPDRIERDILIDAPPERVWAVVTEARHLGVWFGDAGATIDLRPGGEIALTWARAGLTRARIERVEPPRFLSYRWVRGRAAEPDPGRSTLVEMLLEPEGAGTRLTVVESGLRSLDMSEAELADYAAKNGKGWRAELDELRAYVAAQLAWGAA